MLVNTNEILKKACEGKYAVAHFNMTNLETCKYILEECQNTSSPVIIGTSEGAVKYLGGYDVAYAIVSSLIASLNITIPVSLHLDHGTSVDSCKKAIDAGYTSVMIDASKYEFEENKEITKEVTDYASSRNVSVEAELGHIGGVEDGISGGVLYADEDESREFTKYTKITSFAPALGTSHGPYKGQPNLNFDLASNISEATKLPLVLHGGSGISDELIKQIIEHGVCKINIDTELRMALTKGMREIITENEKVYDPRTIISKGEIYFKDIVKEKLTLFGSINKA